MSEPDLPDFRAPRPTPPTVAPEPADPVVHLKADLRRILPVIVLAVLFFALGVNLGGLSRSTRGEFTLFGHVFIVPRGWVLLIIVVLAILFVVFGIMASRAVGRELGRVSTSRAGLAVGAAVRLVCMIVGYLTVGFGVLALLKVDIGSLLVGGAVTGVVIGIAAQQTLGNFFAGLVLLFARPYAPGQRVTVHTGAMGGPFEGVIVETNLLYTVLVTDDGPVNLPNSGVLAAAIGPARTTAADTEEPL